MPWQIHGHPLLFRTTVTFLQDYCSSLLSRLPLVQQLVGSSPKPLSGLHGPMGLELCLCLQPHLPSLILLATWAFPQLLDRSLCSLSLFHILCQASSFLPSSHPFLISSSSSFRPQLKCHLFQEVPLTPPSRPDYSIVGLTPTQPCP